MMREDLEIEMETLVSSSQSAKETPTVEIPHNISLSNVAKSWTFSRIFERLWKSIKVVIFTTKINMLLPFGPMSIILHYLTKIHGFVFFFSLIGISPLAERLGYATEQLAFYTGPTVGGLLNATFGNATEMIIAIYALKKGMIRVVQQSLLGSILSNMLLVLGCAFFTGGIIHSKKDQVFNKAAAVVNSGLLLMAVMGLTFPAVLHFTRSEVQYGKSEVSLSRFSSCVMLVAYASYLVFQLKSHRNLYDPIDEEEGRNQDDSDEVEVPELGQWEAISWLAVLTIWISVLSEYLVNAIEGASESLNLPVAFISVVLLPLVGNAAEHASAIMFAVKDKLDITLGVAIGSSTQLSMFVIPSCVVVGWIMGKHMDLNFQLFETAVLFITVLVVAFMLQGASESLNLPVAFISVVLLPLVGNAAEHASAIMFAVKDKLDITLGVAIGSSTQLSMFVIPSCVVVGWIMGKHMDLNFQLFETAVLFITVLVVAFMLQLSWQFQSSRRKEKKMKREENKKERKGRI
ncbi:putative Vacuolar cation/proton exchanger 3 [Cocos nucifera]|uniref:Vacuolar cation/proton exchanger n=1 Tax=Cocos nucifera TaxID=13894 RepID=A0A8K0MYC9_COCNU|nr:putative Vacuolar cation/proton exchanger 3 [Cocos nucifera]